MERVLVLMRVRRGARRELKVEEMGRRERKASRRSSGSDWVEARRESGEGASTAPLISDPLALHPLARPGPLRPAPSPRAPRGQRPGPAPTTGLRATQALNTPSRPGPLRSSGAVT